MFIFMFIHYIHIYVHRYLYMYMSMRAHTYINIYAHAHTRGPLWPSARRPPRGPTGPDGRKHDVRTQVGTPVCAETQYHQQRLAEEAVHEDLRAMEACIVYMWIWICGFHLTYIHVHMHAYMYTYSHMYVCMYVYIYVCIHCVVHIHLKICGLHHIRFYPGTTRFPEQRVWRCSRRSGPSRQTSGLLREPSPTGVGCSTPQPHAIQT
jgi:hypothetical protein